MPPNITRYNYGIITIVCFYGCNIVMFCLSFASLLDYIRLNCVIITLIISWLSICLKTVSQFIRLRGLLGINETPEGPWSTRWPCFNDEHCNMFAWVLWSIYLCVYICTCILIYYQHTFHHIVIEKGGGIAYSTLHHHGQ